MRTQLSIFVGILLLIPLGYGVLLHRPDAAPAPSDRNAVRPVNAVLGNASYRALYGTTPSPNTPERLRLQTHLAYVEGVLRSRSRPSLSLAQQTRRSRLLDALRSYWKSGQFPENTEVPGRSPVFIDEQGRLCAVGHLIAVSAGRDVAERIDAQYHLADVRNMALPVIDRWAKRYGFTRRELAMIQPTYDGCCDVAPSPNEEEPSPLEITALSASVGASIVNGVLLERGSPSAVGGSVGILGGATSLTIGLSADAKYPTASSLAGATSVILGSWNLLSALGAIRAEKALDKSLVRKDQTQNLSVGPTTLTTVDGTTKPGVQATLQF